MLLAFETQNLSPIERARVELAMGEHASLDVQAAIEEAMEHVGNALAVAVGVILVEAGACAPVA